MRILIVDDNTTFLDTMGNILTLDQHEISTATSAEEALELIIKENYDLLLTDLKMGELSGIDLIREIRKRGVNLISIVITGYGSIDSAVEAMKTGAYDYLLKPFEISPLRKKIEEVQKEVRFRDNFSISPVMSDPTMQEYSIERNFKEYEQPFLVISNENPQRILDDYNIENASTIHLSFTNNEINMIPPTKLHLLRQEIEEFITTQEKGTIVFKGLEELYRVHNWRYFKGFIDDLGQQILSSSFSLIFLVEENQKNIVYQSLVHDALAILSVQSFNSIIKLISHPLRKNIINLLKSQGKLNFNKIIEELKVESSSSFAFHLKKLVQENILEKDDHSYYLTSRGHYFAEIIFILEKIGFVDPGSKIKALNHIRREDRDSQSELN